MKHQKLFIFATLTLSLISVACSQENTANSSETLIPNSTSTPQPGSTLSCSNNKQKICFDLTQDFDTDYRKINPNDKEFLDKSDVGADIDNFLEGSQFPNADKNNDSLLSKEEMNEFLYGGNGLVKLGGLCKCESAQ